MNGAILTTFDPADPANKAETDKLCWRQSAPMPSPTP